METMITTSTGYEEEVLPHLAKLNQDQTSKLDRHIMVEEIERVIQSVPTNKKPRAENVSAEFYKFFK